MEGIDERNKPIDWLEKNRKTIMDWWDSQSDQDKRYLVHTYFYKGSDNAIEWVESKEVRAFGTPLERIYLMYEPYTVPLGKFPYERGWKVVPRGTYWSEKEQKEFDEEFVYIASPMDDEDMGDDAFGTGDFVGKSSNNKESSISAVKLFSTKQQVDANARLMAAAPAMLDHLKDLKRSIRSNNDDEIVWEREVDRLINLALID